MLLLWWYAEWIKSLVHLALDYRMQMHGNFWRAQVTYDSCFGTDPNSLGTDYISDPAAFDMGALRASIGPTDCFFGNVNKSVTTDIPSKLPFNRQIATGKYLATNLQAPINFCSFHATKVTRPVPGWDIRFTC